MKRRSLAFALILALLGLVGGSLYLGFGRDGTARPAQAWYCPAPPVAC